MMVGVEEEGSSKMEEGARSPVVGRASSAGLRFRNSGESGSRNRGSFLPPKRPPKRVRWAVRGAGRAGRMNREVVPRILRHATLLERQEGFMI